MYFLFCFKQKKAYDVRISDWSSGVCSSDLPRADAAVGTDLADGEQLDDRAHVARARDVGGRHLGDALAVDIGRGDRRVEGDAGQDGGLGGGVETYDVGGRVGFGVAERLGLLERVGASAAGRVHAVEDVVSGAVD